jgi:hypothetical protein
MEDVDYMGLIWEWPVSWRTGPWLSTCNVAYFGSVSSAFLVNSVSCGQVQEEVGPKLIHHSLSFGHGI